MITSTTSGVWELDDTYAKINAERWRPGQESYELYVWGYNASGQLAQNDTAWRSSPAQIPGTQWSQINATYASTRALKTDGTLWAWGYNPYGQLGQNNKTYRSSPIQVPGTQWDKIGTGEGNSVTFATKTDGTLWVWGYNYLGRLGLNDNANRSSPVQVPGTQWTNPHLNGYASFCFKTDGTLWAWGYNTSGQLGQNNLANYSSPIQVPGTQWTFISGNLSAFTLATKSDGTLWAWGNNDYSKLGQNNTTQYSSPVQIPGTQWSTNLKSIACDAYASYATKTDGTLWSWGYNPYGNLGQNNTTPYSSPIQIPGTQWSRVEAGYTYHVSCLKTDGTLWMWGYGAYGKLGQNNTTYRSSPIQIPGTGWYDISSGSYHQIAIKQVFTY